MQEKKIFFFQKKKKDKQKKAEPFPFFPHTYMVQILQTAAFIRPHQDLVTDIVSFLEPVEVFGHRALRSEYVSTISHWCPGIQRPHPRFQRCSPHSPS
jgi:hypothetical protein